jgi:putative isomerase
MYDDSVYDPTTHQLEFADVGLMSMYIADCDALAQIAGIPQQNRRSRRTTPVRDRQIPRPARHALGPRSLRHLPQQGSLHTGQLSHRLSPTNFYPLLAKAATPEQAERMVSRAPAQPSRVLGRMVIPSIARNDPAFKDQDYWRGRIWGPMNYLVYLGLRNYDQPEIPTHENNSPRNPSTSS